MAGPKVPVFERFLRERKADLQRIARHTQGEHQYSDVVSEVWLLAHELGASKGVAVDFLDAAFQKLLISHAYQRLVRYTEQNMRRAVRLDHPSKGEDRENGSHALMNTLVSDDGRDPLAMLIEPDPVSEWDVEIDPHYSLASAYVCLLRHFDNSMRAVAEHLLISISYAYRRCAHARVLAAQQHPVPLSVAHGQFVPRPWRRFRIQRIPLQLLLDFEETPSLGLTLPQPSAEQLAPVSCAC